MTWFEDFPDEVYLEQFVVHNDGDSYELVAQAPGPAGAVDVELDDDLTVMVDFVESDRAASLLVDGGEVPDLMSGLIGGERTSRLARHLAAGTRRARRLTVERDDTERLRQLRRQPSLNRFPATREAAVIGAVAVLQSIGDDDRFDDVTRAFALLQSIEQRELGDGSIDPGRDTDEVLDEAALLFEGAESTLRALALRDEFLAAELSRHCVVYSRGRPAIERASRVLNASPDDLGREAVLARPEARIAKDETTGVVIGRPAIELTPGGLLCARFDSFVPGRWVRVVHRGPMVLLALVPLMEDDTGGIATAVVGSGHTLDQLDLEITDAPLPEPTSTIDRIARAVALGRSAAVVMAVDEHAAVDAWLQCAAAWDELGDVRRARLARRYAKKGRPTWREPFWAERVHAALDGIGR